MGAVEFEDIEFGKNATEAFNRAYDKATFEYGHDPYSGTIAAKNGFVEVTLPPRVMAPKVLANLRDAVTPNAFAKWKAECAQYPNGSRASEGVYYRRGAKAFKWLEDRLGYGAAVDLVERYHDKWGPAIAMEVTGAGRDRFVRSYGKLPRGSKVYLFTGWAPY